MTDIISIKDFGEHFYILHSFDGKVIDEDFAFGPMKSLIF